MVPFRCKNCKWFDRTHKSLKEFSDDYGYCRKHKPVIFRFNDKHYGEWPLVDINDFCGEFRQDEEV